MAVRKLKKEIVAILKDVDKRKTRKELSKNKFETYVFKLSLISEWCDYCIELAKMNTAPGVITVKRKMVRQFFKELENGVMFAKQPLSYEDLGNEVVITKMTRGAPSFESSNSTIRPAVKNAKRAAIHVLKTAHGGGKFNQTGMEAALHGHHGGVHDEAFKTTLGMVNIQDKVRSFSDAPMERLVDEGNAGDVGTLSDVIRHSFKDYIEINMGWTRESRRKEQVNARGKGNAKINIFNDIEIQFALGAGAKGKKYTNAMDDWDTRRGKSKKLPKAIDDILNKVGKDVIDFIKKNVQTDPFKPTEVQGSPSANEIAAKAAPREIIRRMFPHKTKPDMRFKVNKSLVKSIKMPKKTSTGLIASKTAKGKAEKSKKAKGPNKVQQTASAVVQQGAMRNPMALRNLLNELIPQAVAKNMTAPALRFRTGRLANSVRVDNITQGPRGGNTMIETSYATDPYGTYAPGGKKYTTQRDPERLIKRSVREVASGLLGQRFGVQVDR